MHSVKGSLIVFALVGMGQLSSQTIINNDDNKEITSSKAEDAVTKRLSDTKALLMADREDDAESRIEQGAPGQSQSAEWFQSKAADFLRVALSAQLAGDTKMVAKAVRHTLAQLDKAEALSKDDPETLAGIAELRGFIQERLLGTSTEAANQYKVALALKPDSDSARRKVSLLDKDTVKPSTTEIVPVQK